MNNIFKIHINPFGIRFIISLERRAFFIQFSYQYVNKEYSLNVEALTKHLHGHRTTRFGVKPTLPFISLFLSVIFIFAGGSRKWRISYFKLKITVLNYLDSIFLSFNTSYVNDNYVLYIIYSYFGNNYNYVDFTLLLPSTK